MQQRIKRDWALCCTSYPLPLNFLDNLTGYKLDRGLGILVLWQTFWVNIVSEWNIFTERLLLEQHN